MQKNYQKLINKKCALFNSNGGGSADKFFQSFKNELKGNEFIGEISFKDPLKENIEDNLNRAKMWIREVIEKI